MKSVLLPGQIMFYLRICNFQAQLGTRDIQKFDFKKVLFTSKKLKFMILDRLPKQPTIPYRDPPMKKGHCRWLSYLVHVYRGNF